MARLAIYYGPMDAPRDDTIQKIDFTKPYDRDSYSRLFTSWLGNLGYVEDPLVHGYNEVVDESEYKYLKEYKVLGQCPKIELTVIEALYIGDDLASILKEIARLVCTLSYKAALVVLVYKDKAKIFRLILLPYVNDLIKAYSIALGSSAKSPYAIIEGKPPETMEGLVESFRIEPLKAQLIEKLYSWYTKALPIVRFPKGYGKYTKLVSYEDTPKYIGISLKRLLVRMLALYFIKCRYQAVLKSFLDEGALKEILAAGIDLHSIADGRYYNAILQNIFFVGLSSPNREFTGVSKGKRDESYSIKTKFRDDTKLSYFSKGHDTIIKAMEKLPYIGDSIFLCQDFSRNAHVVEYRDGFSREPSRRAFIPNALFFGNKEFEGLIGILDSYNFSIKEEASYYNTPAIEDRALTPDILANFIEAIKLWDLDATSKTDMAKMALTRPSSLYEGETIRSMVDSSLKDYFSHIVARDKVEELFSKARIANLDGEDKKAIIEGIKKVKILDPLCYNGSIILAMLERLEDIYSIVAPIEDANASTKAQETYRRTLGLIQNSLYGLDTNIYNIQVLKLRLYYRLMASYSINLKQKDGSEAFPCMDEYKNHFIATSVFSLVKDMPITEDIRRAKEEFMSLEERLKGHIDLSLRQKTIEEQDKLRAAMLEALCANKASSSDLAYTNFTNSIIARFSPWWLLGVDYKSFDLIVSAPDYKSYNSLIQKLYYGKATAAMPATAIFTTTIENILQLLHDRGRLTIAIPTKLDIKEVYSKDFIDALYKLLEDKGLDKSANSTIESATIIECHKKLD